MALSLTLPPGLVSTVISGTAEAGASLALPTILGQITSLFAPHVAAAATPAAPAPDVTKKTMTVAWATANPSLVPLYMATGYTIVP